MGLPARDEAREWVGWTVVDREGAELGACTAVLADQSTGVPEWVYVEVEGASAVVPALDADGSGGRVTVAVTRAQVTAAPSVGGARELSTTQEADLYRHYGIDVSREASETLLPAEAEDTATAVDTATTANAAAAADTLAPADTPAPADSAATADTSAPADIAAAADTGTPAASRRGPAVAVVALAAAAGLGVVRARLRRPVVRQSWHERLWARRPWAPVPPSRAELVAGQVLAASMRARAGARHLGVTVVPLAAAAAESARHRAVRAGEGARHLGVMAAPLAAATAESARHRVVRTGEGARHLGRTIAPLAAATAESARHRAALGAEELRHATRLASGAAVTAVARARARV
jgi:hypothetical protein